MPRTSFCSVNGNRNCNDNGSGDNADGTHATISNSKKYISCHRWQRRHAEKRKTSMMRNLN